MVGGAGAFRGSERYVIRRKIGSGGMGNVYEALDVDSNSTVALKVLASTEARWTTQFKTEFRALADVVHPNLVTMYELVAGPEHTFFTMELVDGSNFLRYVRPRARPNVQHRPLPVTHTQETGSLSDEEPAWETGETAPHSCATSLGTPRALNNAPVRRVPDSGILDHDRLRDSLAQLAEAVMAIHDAGMLHRDLKPSNVLVTPAGRLVVLDFGLITAMADEPSQSSDRHVIGTVPFMAPEQCARRELTQAADWYAVGVMLYQALTGRLPFPGNTRHVLLKKLRFDPPPPNQIARDVPDDLNNLCVGLLRRTPQLRPGGRDVLRCLGKRAPTQPNPQSPAATVPLIGRRRHRAALADAFETTRRGKAVLAFVRGQSGMGKSALVRGILDELGENAVVLRGRCYERESVPFKAVDSVVDALARHLLTLPPRQARRLIPRHALALARVFPALRQVDGFASPQGRRMHTSDPHALRWLAFGALRELLTSIAEHTPVIVAVDDLQWGDVDSAELLAALLAPPTPPAILVLGCYRPEDARTNPFLTTFAKQTRQRGIDIRTVDVGPLSRSDARQLAALRLGEHAGDREHVERVADESAGSPFFIEELARHVGSTGASPGPVSLDDALRWRIDRLPEAARQLLTTIAIAGRPIPQAVARDAAEISDPAMLSLLKVSCFVRTLSTPGQRYVETYHDRVRETVVSMLGDEDKGRAHLLLAEAIEATPNPDAEILAMHYYRGGNHDRAAQFAELAARRGADSLAFDQAARMYRLALELTRDDNAIGRLQTQLGDALHRAGHSVDAATAYLDAIKAGVSGDQQVELKRRAAEELLRGGYIAAGLRLVDELLDSVNVPVPSTPNRALLSLLVGRLRLSIRTKRASCRPEDSIPTGQLRQIDTAFAVATCLGQIDAVRAAALGARHLSLALNAGEPFRILQGLASDACFVSVKGHGQRARTETILAQVDELANRVDTPEARAFMHGARGLSSFQFGDWQQAYDHCAVAHRLFRDECTGRSWGEATATIFQAHSLAFLGRIRELNDFVDRALQRAAERGDHYLNTSLRLAVRFYAHARDDAPDAAIAEIERSLARWDSGQFDQQVWTGLLAFFVIDGYAGEPERGIARHHQYWQPLKKSRLMASQVLRAHHTAFLARLYLQAGARSGNRSQLRRVARAARKLHRLGPAYARGFAAMLRAGLARYHGDDDTALDQLQAADIYFGDSSMELNRAACSVRRGQLLGGDEGVTLIAGGTSFIEAAGMRNTRAVVTAICPGLDE